MPVVTLSALLTSAVVIPPLLCLPEQLAVLQWKVDCDSLGCDAAWCYRWARRFLPGVWFVFTSSSSTSESKRGNEIKANIHETQVTLIFCSIL